MDVLLGLINAIATPAFVEHLSFINDLTKKASESNEYAEKLRAWNLVSELHLLENDEKLLGIIGTNKALIKIYKQLPFKDGKYKRERYAALADLL